MQTDAIMGTTDYIRITHPVTGGFVCEFDPARGLLFVKQRGQTAAIDLERIKQEWRQAREISQD